MNKRIALLSLLYCCVLQTGLAQKLWKLQNTDVSVKGLLMPLTPLPDSFKTYHIVAKTEIDPRYLLMDEATVKSAFRFESFERKDFDADMTLSVNIKSFRRSSTLKTRQDTTKQTFYWYEESIEPDIQVVLTDKSGKLLNVQNGGLSVVYKTMEKKSEQAAKLEFERRFQDPVYSGSIADVHYKTLQNRSESLRNNFDYQPETISLYAAGKNDPVYAKTIASIQAALGAIRRGPSQTALWAGLQPDIAYLEKELASLNPNSKKQQWRYYACAMTLANVYRCFDDYDHALQFVGLAIADGYYGCQALTAHLAAMKERFNLSNYYKKTGRNLFKDKAQQALARLDSLKKQPELEGYIVLNNNSVVKGTVLQVVDNFTDLKVKLKYEKKLNAPVEDVEYLVADVKEIHAGGWDLFVIPFLSKFYLSEIVFQSPKITMWQPLPGMGNRNPASKTLEDISFLRINKERKFTPLYNSQIKSLSRYLKDCPKVAKQAQYGYYTTHQLLEAVQDYNNACGSAPLDTAAAQPLQTIGTKRAPSRSPGFYLGFSTGANNFTSLVGLHATFRLKNKLFARVGTGLGFWGTKFAASLQYDLRRDMRYRQGWSFAFGYGYSAGLNKPLSVTSERSTTVAGATTSKEVDVSILESPVSTVALSTIFYKFFGAKTSLFLELGYAASLQKEPWVIQPGGVGAEHAKPAIKIFQPGGIVLGIGVNFAF